MLRAEPSRMPEVGCKDAEESRELGIASLRQWGTLSSTVWDCDAWDGALQKRAKTREKLEASALFWKLHFFRPAVQAALSPTAPVCSERR